MLAWSDVLRVAASLREALKLIRLGYALLLWVCSTLYRLERAVAPRYSAWRPSFHRGLRPSTRKTYARELNAFLDWLGTPSAQSLLGSLSGPSFGAVEAHMQPEFAWEFDECLLLYSGRVTKSRFSHLLSAVEKALPQFKWELKGAHELLKEWHLAVPTVHTVVCPWEATLAIGKAGATNAGLMAGSIVALSDPKVDEALAAWRKARTESVAEIPTDEA